MSLDLEAMRAAVEAALDGAGVPTEQQWVKVLDETVGWVLTVGHWPREGMAEWSLRVTSARTFTHRGKDYPRPAEFQFDGMLTPLSMAVVSAIWPLFAGEEEP